MTDRFAFRKSWGAELLESGAARFRLWAPAQAQVAVRFEANDRVANLDRAADGWFEIELPGLRPDTAYSFVVGDGMTVPDPAARAQMSDVHGPSRLVDPLEYEWKSAGWTGRPWEEAVIYELHVGTFDPAGDFDGVRRRLDHLARIGITAVELMPVAQFAGRRGWGYDGVLPYCPHHVYGGPEGLKRLVDAAHERNLMVLLDIVYNHFGPEGNYLHAYAPEFFDHDRQTPWGDAIRFSARPVRDFFIENALYWLQEYRLDGLRLDAIDQILDTSAQPVLEELAERVRAEVTDRPAHLTTEDERNIIHFHPRDPDGHPLLYTAEWNDDIHHAAHALATGESEGYYRDFASDAIGCLLHGLSEGFIFQGEPYSPWANRNRGVRSIMQPPAAFVDFLQNHDQVGNRAFGERLSILAEPRMIELLTAVLLLNPQIPLLFMGEEYGETRPFLFFTDFTGDLADAVREGRRREFAEFAAFADAGDRQSIPDPNDATTFDACRLDWDHASSPEGRARLDLVERLLAVRRTEIAPRLRGTTAMRAIARRAGDRAFDIAWHLGEVTFRIVANFAETAVTVETLAPSASVVFESVEGAGDALIEGRIDGHSLVAIRQSR